LRVQQMMKGSNIGIQEKKAKLFNEWERFTSNKGESIESYYHRFLKLINDLKRNKHFPEKIAYWSQHVTIVHQTKDFHTANYTQLYDFLKYNQKEVDELKAERLAKTQDPLALMANSNNPYVFPAPYQDQPSFNQNYLQQPMPNPKDITDSTTAMNMALSLMAKAFKLNYSTPTNNNQRISSNPMNRQIAQPGINMGQDKQMQMVRGNGGNQFRQHAWQNAWNPAGNQNQIGNGNLVAARAEGNVAGENGNQIRCYNCRGEEARIQLQAEEYDLMVAAADLDEIEEVNANCILMANLQQTSTSCTQTNSTPVYDTDGSAEKVQRTWLKYDVLLGFSGKPVHKQDMRRSKNEANVPKLFNKNVVPRKTRSLTVAEETVAYELANPISIKEPRTQHRRNSQLRIYSQIDEDVVDTYAEWGQRLKGPAVDDPTVQSLLNLRKISKASRLESLKPKKQPVTGEGSSAAHTKYYDNLETNSDAILYSSCSDTSKESANETDDVDESDMDLTDDNPVRDNDAAGYGTLLDETPVNELIDLMSHPVYTDAHTTLVVHNQEGNPEVRSFQSGASEVPIGKQWDRDHSDY
nr:hypothetical protein [Tanacetum cinerariifolium]